MAEELKGGLEGGLAGPTAAYRVRLPSARPEPEKADEGSHQGTGALGAAAMLLLALFALDCWRAVQQSITHDEALAYARALAAGGGDDPHAVHAVLARVCAVVAGPQEWVLRLPSLLGALVYLVAGLSLCRAAFGRGWASFLGFGLLALHPLLLDFQSLGRGDGLGLGLMLWGALHLLLLARGTASGSAANYGPAHAIAGSLLLGLAAASGPATLPAAASLIALAVAVTLAQRRRLPGGASAGGRIGVSLAGLVLTGPVIAALLLWLPVSQAGSAAVWTGDADVLAAARALADASLAHQPDGRPLAPEGPAYEPARAALLLGFGPLLVLAIVLRLRSVLRHWRGATSLAELDGFERFHVLIGGSYVLTLLLIAAGHVVLGLPWPDARTGAPVLVLSLLCATGLAAEGWSRGRTWRLLSLPALAALVALLLQFGSQLQIAEYHLWKHDAGARRCFEQIVRRQDKDPRFIVRVAAAAPLQPALDFYRVTRRAGWMQPVSAGFDPEHPEADFLVLPKEQVAPSGYSPLLTDPAGVVILERARP
jgi:hypothetical protein